MTPPASVLGQEQEVKDAPGKHVKDFVGEDIAISANGNVTGTLHYVKDMGTIFPDQSEGHYMPVQMDSALSGRTFTCVGTQEKSSTDLNWLLFVKDNGSRFTFSTKEDGTILTLTFAGAVLEAKT